MSSDNSDDKVPQSPLATLRSCLSRRLRFQADMRRDDPPTLVKALPDLALRALEPRIAPAVFGIGDTQIRRKNQNFDSRQIPLDVAYIPTLAKGGNSS
jgi:hypothetical protein